MMPDAYRDSLLVSGFLFVIYHEMPEITDKYVRVPNPKFEGECAEVRTIDISAEAGIKGLFCIPKKMIMTYLFDKDKWDMEKASKWVAEHNKDAGEDMEMKRISAKTEKSDGKIVAIASEEVEDREGEVISVKGWDLSNFNKSPRLLWMHNRNPAHNGLPVGRAENMRVEKFGETEKLVFEPVFDESTEFNKTVKAMYEANPPLLDGFSVGFLPLEREGNRYTKQELLEVSAVPVPALATATVIARAKELGIKEKDLSSYLNMPKKAKKKAVKRDDAAELGKMRLQVKEILHAIRAVRAEMRREKSVQAINYSDHDLVKALRLLNKATGYALNRVKSQKKGGI
jgi:uncharacterized protein